MSVLVNPVLTESKLSNSLMAVLGLLSAGLNNLSIVRKIFFNDRGGYAAVASLPRFYGHCDVLLIIFCTFRFYIPKLNLNCVTVCYFYHV